MKNSLKKVLPDWAFTPVRAARRFWLSVGLPRNARFQQPENEIEASREISAIVAINDAPAALRRCLKSLEDYAPGAQVILVDDASRLREAIEIIEDFGSRNSWQIIRNKQPRGHSRCCEAGALLSSRSYLCLLNSDTIVSPWSWSAVKAAFATCPEIGVVGPSTSYASTRQMLPRAMHCRNHWNQSQIFAFAKQHIDRLPSHPLIDLPGVGGFALFIRRKLWFELGGFDLNLPDYGNESELCRRAAKAGWRIVWTPDSYIHHLGHQSYGRMGEGALANRTRAARQYIDSIHGQRCAQGSLK